MLLMSKLEHSYLSNSLSIFGEILFKSGNNSSSQIRQFEIPPPKRWEFWCQRHKTLFVDDEVAE
jgi:hypothetical protein